MATDANYETSVNYSVVDLRVVHYNCKMYCHDNIINYKTINSTEIFTNK